MGSIWKENYRRAAKKNSVSATDGFDLLRVEDIAGLGAGSGVYRVTHLTAAGPQVAPGATDEIFEFVIIEATGSYDVVLPDNALDGKRYEIKDGAGDGCLGSVNKRILTTGSQTIEGLFTEFPLSNCYQSWSVIYAGGDIWRLV